MLLVLDSIGMDDGNIMNILFMSESFYPHGGGGEFATNFYARNLAKYGHNVTVFTNRFQGETREHSEKNLTIYRVPISRGNIVFKYSTLKRFDIIFSGFMSRMIKWADIVYVPLFWYSAIPLAKAYKKPVVVHLHGYFPICPIATWYNMSKDKICNSNIGICSLKCIYIHERTQGKDRIRSFASAFLNSNIGRCLSMVVNMADAIVCVSSAQKNTILAHMPSIQAKTHVIYNPLPNLSHIQIEDDDFGYFGGASHIKGFGVLCTALTELKACIKVHAANLPGNMIGTARTKSSSIIPYPKLGQEEQERLYGIIRGVIFPSICPEPFPYVVAEAVLRGRVVIASKVGGVPEQVRDCEGVFLVEPGNPNVLAEKLLYVKSLSREAVAELGIKNREAFTSRFSNEKVMHDFLAICEDLTYNS